MRDNFRNGYILPPYIRSFYQIAPFFSFPIILVFLSILWKEAIQQINESYAVLVFASLLTLAFAVLLVNFLRMRKYVSMQFYYGDEKIMNTCKGLCLSVTPPQKYNRLKTVCYFYVGKGKTEEIYYLVYKNDQETPQITEIEGLTGLIQLWKKKYLILPEFCNDKL